jgi:plasmid stability protein
MPNMTIRNIPDDVHRALRTLATRHGRSAEAEVREILRRATESSGGIRFGDELAALGEAIGGVELDLQRSTKPLRTADLS